MTKKLHQQTLTVGLDRKTDEYDQKVKIKYFGQIHNYKLVVLVI